MDFWTFYHDEYLPRHRSKACFFAHWFGAFGGIASLIKILIGHQWGYLWLPFVLVYIDAWTGHVMGLTWPASFKHPLFSMVAFWVMIGESLVGYYPWTNQPMQSAERDPRWATVRNHWLIDHDRCEACGTKKELEVHHVYPVHWPNGQKLELDESNFMTLCRTDHLRVGHLEEPQPGGSEGRDRYVR